MSSESKAAKPRRDDLPAIKISRLRALHLITPAMKTVRLELEGLAFDVGLAHTRFPNGGGWSYFICPCGRLAQTLRLLKSPPEDGRPDERLIGRLVCRTCDGLLARCQMETDKRGPIERLIKRLEGPTKHGRRGKLKRSLRRKLIVERERRLKGWKG